VKQLFQLSVIVIYLNYILYDATISHLIFMNKFIN